jgi:hypothetical protein
MEGVVLCCAEESIIRDASQKGKRTAFCVTHHDIGAPSRLSMERRAAASA